jgi:hypothetical protein
VSELADPENYFEPPLIDAVFKGGVFVTRTTLPGGQSVVHRINAQGRLALRSFVAEMKAAAKA